MRKNMGTTDRVIRLLLAIVIAMLYLLGKIHGTAEILPGIIAFIFLLTSATGFCLVYVPLRISTKRRE